MSVRLHGALTWVGRVRYLSCPSGSSMNHLLCRVLDIDAYSLQWPSTGHLLLMANNLTLTTGLPCFLAVQWSDAAGVCNLPQEYDEQYVQVGGSTQRGDPQDIEPMVYFAMDKFMSLGA